MPEPSDKVSKEVREAIERLLLRANELSDLYDKSGLLQKPLKYSPIETQDKEKNDE